MPAPVILANETGVALGTATNPLVTSAAAVTTSQDVNLKQVNGTTTSVDAGVPDAGSQRVVPAVLASGTGVTFPGPGGVPAAGYCTADAKQYTERMVDPGVIQVRSNHPYPADAASGAAATPITAASGNKANAIAAATLASVASKTTYITGFQITASGATTGLPVNVTVTGVITGTLTFTFVFPAGVLVAAQPLIVTFPTPIPASAQHVDIVVSCPASGTGGTNAAANAQGFNL